MANPTVTVPTVTVPSATETKAPTLLDTLHAEYTAKGGKEGKARKPLAPMPPMMATWKKAKAARDKAEEAFVAASKAESDAVAAIIRNVGKGRLTIDGASYIPMARGETAYLRREGGGDSLDLS